MIADNKPRCAWMGDDPMMLRYHDDEWGVPVHEDRKWFEFMVLDAFQAGLSWKTVLHKRAAFSKVFYGFDPPFLPLFYAHGGKPEDSRFGVAKGLQ
jgi:DNA-3-methyladenine glycosylase I